MRGVPAPFGPGKPIQVPRERFRVPATISLGRRLLIAFAFLAGLPTLPCAATAGNGTQIVNVVEASLTGRPLAAARA